MPAARTYCLTAGLGLAAALLTAHAAEPERTGPPLWEVGAFALGVTQQSYPGSDTQLNRALALPFFVYRGQWLRADRETLGLRAVKTDRVELDLGVAASFGGGNDEIEARRGMRELGTLVELGPRLKLRLGDGPGGGRWRAELPLRGVFDLNDGGSYRGMAFEPRLLFERQTAGGWRYGTALSVILSDRRLADDFYGVGPQDAIPGRPAYAARGGLVATRLSLSVSRSLSPDWRVFGVARYDTVQGAANEDSPLVRKKGGGSLGIGVSYTFARSQAGAYD
jgi:outer membrane scaffolding protein for murein synthesis (MipA/OmpV family)